MIMLPLTFFQEFYMADKSIFVVTSADEKPDKAIIPFTLENTALALNAEASIILQSTGVFSGKKDYSRHFHAKGFPPLQQLMDFFFRKKGENFMPVSPAFRQGIFQPKICLTVSR
jgi:predicted peroxiredoxin